MLFEKVMEEGRSYLKSEMAHRGGGILGQVETRTSIMNQPMAD